MAQMVDWNKKNENYYKFVYMNVMALWNLLALTFENCSKNCGWFNPFIIIII
jgi:hypothetical protein